MSLPQKLVRFENGLALLFFLAAYFSQGYSVWSFAVLFLMPDVSLLAFTLHPDKAALYYNLCHTYMIPLLLMGLGFIFSLSALWPLALIWCAHIAMDRMLGYGLKYRRRFKRTSIQKL